MSQVELSFTEVRAALREVEQALEVGNHVDAVPEVLHALARCRAILTQVADEARVRRISRHDGAIEWTLEDESQLPQMRELDVRVYYNWIDYSPGDRVTPGFGGYAEICDLEVLAVRHLDDQGETIGALPHFTELAWQLLEERKGEVEEACTSAGHRGGVGPTHPLFQPTTPAAQPSGTESKMAPSGRERGASGKLEKSG